MAILLNEALRLGLEEVYVFSPGDQIHYSGYGEMPYIEWLQLEKQRIMFRNPLRRAAIISLAHNSNMIGLFANPPVLWEKEARGLGYIPMTEWLTCDSGLKDMGYVEPCRIILDKRKRASNSERRAVIVRKDGDNMFAVYVR